MTVVVTGATGNIGGRVARKIAAAGLTQRLVVRDPSRAPALRGAEVAQATYSDRDALRQAFAGADVLFFVSAAEAADRLAQHRTVVEAAAEAGVPRMVYLSFLGASPDATFTLARDHWATEEHIRAHLPHFTFLRDSLYADFVPGMVGVDGVLRGPAGTGAASVVAQDDVASVGAAVLLAPDPDEHSGQTYDVTGPEALTFAQIAEVLGAEYHHETVDEAYASRARYGAPKWQVDAWVSTYLAIAAGELSTVSDTVPRLTGHPATSLRQLLGHRG